MKIADDSYKIGRSDGTEGWWGLGAIRSSSPAPGWQCPHHEGKTVKGDHVHIYEDGDEACTTCARAWLVSIGESVSDPDKFEPVVCRIPVRTGSNELRRATKQRKQVKVERPQQAPIPPRKLGSFDHEEPTLPFAEAI